MGIYTEEQMSSKDSKIIVALTLLTVVGIIAIIGLTIGIIVFNSVGYHGPSDSDMEKIFCPWPGGYSGPPPCACDGTGWCMEMAPGACPGWASVVPMFPEPTTEESSESKSTVATPTKKQPVYQPDPKQPLPPQSERVPGVFYVQDLRKLDEEIERSRNEFEAAKKLRDLWYGSPNQARKTDF